jgi:putative ABC transport system permease protein
MASWALAVFVFKIRFALNLAPLAVALAIVSSLTVLTGLLTSRGICTYPPLEVLRREV